MAHSIFGTRISNHGTKSAICAIQMIKRNNPNVGQLTSVLPGQFPQTAAPAPQSMAHGTSGKARAFVISPASDILPNAHAI